MYQLCSLDLWLCNCANNIVTSTIAFEGGGKLAEYVGGYDDWLRQRPATATKATAAQQPKQEKPAAETKADGTVVHVELACVPASDDGRSVRLDLRLTPSAA